MTSKAHYQDVPTLASTIRVARGEVPADLVIKDTRFLDVYTGAFVQGDVAVLQFSPAA